MEKLIKTLPTILAASRDSEQVAEAACIAAWKQAVGEGLRNHTLAVQLQNKTLVVIVEDRVWQKQLDQMRAQLLFRLNAVLGQTLVNSIEWRIDPKLAAQSGGAAEESAKERDYNVPVELLSAAADIEDAELRRAFLGAAISCIRRLEKSET
jgi:predicted nucleic acid-binding Zn ribbon protein